MGSNIEKLCTTMIVVCTTFGNKCDPDDWKKDGYVEFGEKTSYEF